jgi:centromere DNA-binding complex CBF3 subunit-like protein
LLVYVINTLLTHTGRSREREAGDRELWLPTTSAACLVLSCGQLQAFSQAPGNYYLKRGHACRASGKPGFDDLAMAAEALAMYERGDIEKVDLCGIEFLRLLKKLQVVFLQDAAILMKDYPDVEIWSHQVFKESDWPAFSQLVRDSEAVVEEREDIRLREAAPVVAEKITTLQNSLDGLIVGSSARLEAELQEGMVKDLAAKIAVNNQQRERGNMRRRVFVPMDEEEFVRWHQPRDDATSNPVHHAAHLFLAP